MKTITKALGLGTLAAAAAGCSQPQQKPNIVFFFADDIGTECFGYMNDDERTFAHLAQEAGYSTAIVGKWQMGRSREMVPKLGFDESFLSQVELYKECRDVHKTDRFAKQLL